MKKLMILGALLGFLVSTASGRAQGSEWATVFWRGSVVALGTGLLFRWWGRLWLLSLQKVASDRIAANAAAAPDTFVFPLKK